ncbi:MAG: RsbRD N-terminal domain-containing protein [Desulfitobacterium sp.]
MDKALRDLLMEKKSSIIQKWQHEILNTYPKDTARFLKEQNDVFANPVGNTMTQGIEQTFTALLQDDESIEVYSFLKDILKVRAVQTFTPSQAVNFVFVLKKIIREELGKVAEDEHISKALLELDVEVDQLALASFDIYSACRDKLADLKTMELKNMTYRLLQQANLVTERPDLDSSELKAPEGSAYEQFVVKTKRKEGVK